MLPAIGLLSALGLLSAFGFRIGFGCGRRCQLTALTSADSAAIG